MTNPDPYCSQPHPDYVEPREVTALDGTRQVIDTPTVWCRRIKDHPGDHAAYTLSIRTPQTWPAVDESAF